MANSKKNKGPIAKKGDDPVGISNLNIISEGTAINGELVSQSDTRVGGKLIGDLKVEGTVVITDNGFIDGSIHGDDVNISGSVKGKVIATNKVFLTGTAKIIGTISASRLVVEEGAIFNGECLMGGKTKALSSSFVPSSNGKKQKLAKQPA
ncbi:MAG: polymer-forming cytoskeletal protein [Bacteroidetes bacterium]|nr:polymer-forming cytoskeletal protein [Bacteroidota bacterium]MCY4233162.1 polymer-forming cytoskeletal protein [Bacteroidota bacterium]